MVFAGSPIAIDPSPIVDKISSQEIVFAVLVLIISAGLFIFSLKFFFKLITKRDEVIKELAAQIATLNNCLIKVIEVQSLDHSAIIKNRDLLQETNQLLGRSDLNLAMITQEVKNIWRDLKEHSISCSKKEEGGNSK